MSEHHDGSDDYRRVNDPVGRIPRTIWRPSVGRRTISPKLVWDAAMSYNRQDFLFQPEPGVGITPTSPISVVELSTRRTLRAPFAGQLTTGEQSDQHNLQTRLNYVTGSHSAKVGFTWRNGWRATTPDRVQQFHPIQPAQRQSAIGHVDHRAVHDGARTGRRRGHFCPGQVDAAPSHGDGRRPIRLFQGLDSRAVGGRGALDWCAHVCGSARRPELERHRPAAGSGVRPVWEREDGDQGERQPLPDRNRSMLFPRSSIHSTRACNTATRTWNDGINGNPKDFIPQGDPLNPLPNGEFLGTINPNFGKTAITTRYDSDLSMGWGKRPYNWEYSASVQQELLPRVSLEVGYYRRIFGNQTVTDNLDVTPADFDPFCITAPTDPRLGSVSGSQVCGLYDVTVREGRRRHQPDHHVREELRRRNQPDLRWRRRHDERPTDRALVPSGRGQHRADRSPRTARWSTIRRRSGSVRSSSRSWRRTASRAATRSPGSCR